MEKTTLIGNLGFDAETRTFNEKEYFLMTIAHQRRKDDPTIWYHCFYRKTPNNSTLMQYLKKGCKVYVDGNLSARAYISQKDNEAKVDLSVWVNNLEIITFAKKDETPEQVATPVKKEVATPYYSMVDNSVEPDLPF